MIDGGNSANHVAIYMEELDKRQLSHPKFVTITHWHWDHTFGISATNAVIIANSLTNKQLCKMRGWKWMKNLWTSEWPLVRKLNFVIV
ncbi:hypothetical protein JTT07_02870 [Clostridium botulinum]|nr:hypothetical protein [Clostridium botulinum]